ncbi:MAG TPA: YceI family protein [Acidobacteriaceae bacterium]|jgi:polyisoprenoid-binding protein YceI|nr:YceI family protein [Acidobacteriaceae bacterium]
MRLAKLVGVVLAAAAPLAMAQTSTWKADPYHSEVGFTVTHLGITKVHGRFGKVDATMQWDEADPGKSSVHATIEVTGVDTGVVPRDNDLKSDHFFDVAKYPTATFESTSVEKTGSGLEVKGNLTLKGVTKPVVLHVEGPTGPVTGMDKKPHIGFEATTTVQRSDFGIAAGMPSAMVSDDVQLEIDLDFSKQ